MEPPLFLKTESFPYFNEANESASTKRIVNLLCGIQRYDTSVDDIYLPELLDDVEDLLNGYFEFRQIARDSMAELLSQRRVLGETVQQLQEIQDRLFLLIS